MKICGQRILTCYGSSWPNALGWIKRCEAIQAGAYDVILLPVIPELLRLRVCRAMEKRTNLSGTEKAADLGSGCLSSLVCRQG